VATAGDVNGDGFSDLIVGLPFDADDEPLEGRVLVYHGSPAGLSETPSWAARGHQPGAEFGCSVATAGDVNGDGFSDVIIGAWKFDSTESDTGRVFVYFGSPEGLASSPAWTFDGDQVGARLGGSVAPAGDVNGDGYADVIVGAANAGNGEPTPGRAYVFHGSPTGLAATPAWTADGGHPGALFGAAVATAGDVNGDGFADVIVGSPEHSNGQAGEGRASVFLGSAVGVLASPVWTAEGNQDGALFGADVSTAGDVNGDGFSDLIIGSPGYDGENVDEGRVFVYLGVTIGVSGLPAWTSAGDQAGAAHGSSVAAAGDVNGDGYCDIAIGARGLDTHLENVGRVSIHLGSANGVSDQTAEVFHGDQDQAGLGCALAPAGDINGDGFADVVFGGTVQPESPPGAATTWMHYGSATGLAQAPGWASECNQGGASCGWSVASAGDVNGDGFGDIIVGAINYDNGEPNEGAALVFYGSPTGPSATPDWIAEGNQAFAEFGYAVGTAGDVNGDGFDDVIIGSPQYSNGEFAEGRAWLYLGSPTGLATTPAWTAESNQIDGRMGRMVGTAGDVNADGFADVMIGCYSYTNGETDEGIALVFHGSPNGLSPNGTPLNADWMTEGNQMTAWYGRTGGAAGDVNGDGYSDVIISAYRYTNGESLEGAVFVYHGSPIGLCRTPNWTAESNQVNAAFGFSAGGAGDVNGDGFSDVIVGAVNYSSGQFWEGAAFVYAGSPGGLATTPLWMTEGNQVEARIGWATGTVGDVNGDGFSDIVATSPLYDNDQVNEGRVFVFHGSPEGPSPTPDWFVEGNQTNGQFGFSVAAAGDINGDGFGDVVVGAPGFDGGHVDEGQSILCYGNSGLGMAAIPRQRRLNEIIPIAHLGRSDEIDAITLSAIGRSPFGRGRVQLEWEIKPLGTPLDGTGLQKSTVFNDTGVAGIPLNATSTNLTCGRAFHWVLRTRYDRTAMPFAPHGPWMTPQSRSRQETHFRTPAVPGDMNCDCAATLSDVSAFVLALVDPAAYATAHPRCGPGADMQPDGCFNGADITAFLELLIGN